MTTTLPQPGAGHDEASRARASSASRAGTPALVVRLGWWAVALQSCVVAWACFKGFFYFSDDYVFRGQGAFQPWFSPDYVLEHWGGHFMPASFVVAQPFAKLGDFGYGWIAVSLVLGQALVAVLLFRTLIRHFGARWRILLPLGLYLTSVPVVQATAWWAAALNMVPFLACIVIVSDRVLRTRGRTDARQYWWIIATTSASLLFFEKSVLLVLLVLGLLWAQTPGGPWTAAGRVVRTHRPLLAGLTGVLVAWALAYTTTGSRPDLPWPTVNGLVDQITSTLLHGVLPSFLGSPWQWFRFTAETYDLARTSPLIQMAALAAASVCAAVLVPCGPRATRALTTLLVWGVAGMVILSIGRPFWGAGDAALPRYFADVSLVASLCLAASLARLVDDPEPDMLREWRPAAGRGRAVLALVVVQAVVLSWVISVVGLVTLTSASTDRVWVMNALASLRAAGPGSPLLNTTVPATVMNPLLTPSTQYRIFFAGLRATPRIEEETDQLRILDGSGALVEAHVDGPAALTGPRPGCGWRIDDAGTWIPMSSQIVYWVHTVHLAYISTEPTPLEITFADGEPQTVSARAGLNDIFANVVGGGSSLRVRAVNPGAVVCVDAVRVGQPVPGPLPAPSR